MHGEVLLLDVAMARHAGEAVSAGRVVGGFVNLIWPQLGMAGSSGRRYTAEIFRLANRAAGVRQPSDFRSRSLSSSAACPRHRTVPSWNSYGSKGPVVQTQSLLRHHPS